MYIFVYMHVVLCFAHRIAFVRVLQPTTFELISLISISIFYDENEGGRSHTLALPRECFKGDEASQWKRPKFDSLPHQNPLTDLHKNWHV